MTEFSELFDALDRDRDGLLTRQELYRVARELGWQQPQAPIYALLDFMTIRTPLDREAFVACMAEVSRDPQGAYGRALCRGPRGAVSTFRGMVLENEKTANTAPGEPGYHNESRMLWDGSGYEGISELLQELLSAEHCGNFSDALKRSAIPSHTVLSRETALLLIDPQRSFTAGDWMRGLGPLGEMEVMPIRLAFDNCARLLEAVYKHAEVMFSRCPFSPESYGWDDTLDQIIDESQLYFIKPSNNLLMPDSNGYREWVQGLLDHGIRTLVMGGCTLNSCLRVSAVATRNSSPGDALELVVDLSLCGARASNYLNSSQFGGISAVEAAMREMSACGVRVAERVVWR
ncbi:MAG: hypothetical protein HXX11_01630 [Desulfuromonadales bacterium]|nr:hypothetical protein [Desulfuromonadales bacterium]